MAGRREWGVAARALAAGVFVGGVWALFFLWMAGALPGAPGGLPRFAAPRIAGMCAGPLLCGAVARVCGGSWRTVAAFVFGAMAGAWLLMPVVIALGGLAAQSTGGRFEL